VTYLETVALSPILALVWQQEGDHWAVPRSLLVLLLLPAALLFRLLLPSWLLLLLLLLVLLLSSLVGEVAMAGACSTGLGKGLLRLPPAGASAAGQVSSSSSTPSPSLQTNKQGCHRSADKHDATRVRADQCWCSTQPMYMHAGHSRPPADWSAHATWVLQPPNLPAEGDVGCIACSRV
jgi:hypothetical protein